MPQTSPWPLTSDAVRFLVPGFIIDELSNHPLTAPLYPNAFGHYPTAQGHAMQRDLHEDNLVIYCRSGKGLVDYGDGWRPLLGGQLLVLPCGVPHRYQSDPDDPWSIWWVHYNGLATTDHHRHWGIGNAAILDVGHSPLLLQQFSALLASRNTGYQLPALIQACAILAYLFTTFAREIASQPLRQQGGQGAQAAGLARARAHMEDCLRGHTSLDELATLAGLSRWHFTRAYRDAYGYSPIQHFLHRKMETACELLDARTCSITDVAYDMGYEDPAYFSRLFRRITGMSPQAYQRSLRS